MNYQAKIFNQIQATLTLIFQATNVRMSQILPQKVQIFKVHVYTGYHMLV